MPSACCRIIPGLKSLLKGEPMKNARLTPSFSVGDHVTAVGFTDCFGVKHESVHGLTVRSVQIIDNSAPHVRLDTIDASGRSRIEGAERFFRHA